MKVLVTGVSGFVGCHVAREFLQAGFAVRGTVRSQKKADEVRSILSSYSGSPDSLEFALVEDVGAEGAFDQVLDGIDVVAHTASPFTFKVEDVEKDLIEPAVHGTVGILTAIKRHGPAVKRVVITSSVAALMTLTPENRDGLSELDWNNGAIETFEKLRKATPPSVAYPASKTLAEKAAWKFLEENPGLFEIAVINPPFIFGPPIHPVPTVNDLNTSVKLIWDFYTGETKEVSPNAAFGFVDVRDVARAHVLAITNPEAKGNRFLVSSGPFTHQGLVEILQSLYPGRKFATGQTTAVPLREINRKSKEVLGIGEFIGLKESVKDTLDVLINKFGNPASLL